MNLRVAEALAGISSASPAWYRKNYLPRYVTVSSSSSKLVLIRRVSGLCQCRVSGPDMMLKIVGLL
jgi:hypothetical protein